MKYYWTWNWRKLHVLTTMWIVTVALIQFYSIKVIPLFCTAHPLLCITLPHPRLRRFVPPARKEQIAFIRNNNGADRLTASWFAIEKQKNERNALDPKVCSGFSLCGRRVVELLKWLAEPLDYGAVKPVGQLYGSPTALKSQYLAWDRYCTYVVQTPRVERRIFLEQIRPTVAPEPREGDLFAVHRNQTSEHMKERTQ